MLGSYFRDYSPLKIPPKLGPIDALGLPLFSLEKLNLGRGDVYHPTVIVQFGLAHYELYLRGQKDSLDQVRRCCQWFEENLVWDSRRRFIGWPIPFAIKFPRVPSGWWSGLTQGQIISLLLRLNALEPSERREKIIHLAVGAFLAPISDEGLISVLDSEKYFIEEAAHQPGIQILNGCLAGLYGLYEYLQIFTHPEVKEVFEKTLNGVEENLSAFDCGWWSLYSLGLKFHWADKYYHRVHIEQLQTLGELWNRPAFIERARLWKQYDLSSFNHFRLWISQNWGRAVSGSTRFLNRENFMFRKPVRDKALQV